MLKIKYCLNLYDNWIWVIYDVLNSVIIFTFIPAKRTWLFKQNQKKYIFCNLMIVHGRIVLWYIIHLNRNVAKAWVAWGGQATQNI